MQTKKVNIANQVHVLTDKTCMKFIPTHFVKQTPKQPPVKLAQPTEDKPSRFSLASIFRRKQIKSANQQTLKKIQRIDSLPVNIKNLDLQQLQLNQERPQTERPKIYKLKFALRLSPEHLIIGNQFQLDILNILGINSNNYVQTQFLFSLKYSTPIDHVSVDQKKQNLLVIITGNRMIVYKYDSKKLSPQPLTPFKQLQIETVPKFVQVVKDGNVCLFYQQKLEIYLVGQQIRSRHNKAYEKPEIVINEKYSYKLYMVPQPYDNIVNVFFQVKKSEEDNKFILWCIQYQFLASQVKVSPPQKIYDIQSSLRKTLNLKNYSKQIFLMNLGNQILALKKGYMLDSANVNLKQQKTYLQYIGNQTLLHISAKKIEVYSFFVNLNVKPNRIIIKSKDSIKINQNRPEDEFFKVLNILSNDLIFIFQKNSDDSKSKSGQIQYSFYITRATSRENKMNQLFPINPGQQFKIDDPVLLDKCDMAEKMGLSTKQIYLQLWNRSQQSRKQDYSILIATKDYSTINQQIIRKLKKASMNFKQIQNIEQACFVMLQQKVFSSSCTQQAVMDYISSHFFKRKLQMFKDIQMMDKFQKEKQTGNEQRQVFKMTIRQYQQYKSMEIKSQLINLVNQFCHENKKHLSKNIRFLLRNFKFVFRIIYYEVLEAIIQNANVKLLNLLQQIPQLLQYEPPQRQSSLHIPIGFYEGVWPEISRQEWNTSLYVDAITTIDNKEIIMEKVIKNINFKRNWLSQHDMVIESVEKIKANYSKIKSPLTFYFFAAKIFEHINDQNALKQIVEFLQATYKLPENLKGTIFLNQRLYRFFKQRNIAPEINGRFCTLSQFFSFEDKQLIRHCFDKQRSNKGLLLKDIKDIFKQVLQDQADQKYNKAILNYFISDLSEVSDLKYILNRINNQKLQFHRENQSMYQILVQALERKLKIGTDNDIPIQQVLIYIQNIPLDLNSIPLQQLNSVSRINRESELLRAAKVNMSVYDILHNSQQVFTKLINHSIQQAPHQIWEDKNLFQDFTIKQLATLQIFAQQIYEGPLQQLNKFIFFLYLAKLCEKTQHIQLADFLLRNDECKDRVSDATADCLIAYMLKWKLSQQKQYVKNQQYINQLLKLLPEQSNTYQFNKAQLQFAKLLSSPDNPVMFPIAQGLYITVTDVRSLIYDLPADFLLNLDIEHLYLTIYKMQSALMKQMQDYRQAGEGDQDQMITPANRITLHQVYELVIVKLIHSNKLKQVLPKIRQILDLNISDTTYNIVYVIIFIIQISTQLNQQNKYNLTQCISYYFYDPKGLLQILEYIINNPLSTSQIKRYIEEALEKGKKNYKGFNQQNPVFDEDYIAVLDDVETQANFMITLNKTSKHLQQAKQEFKNIKYAAIMIMLCNSPYALAKYISCSFSYDLNVKSIRSFLSYAIKENVFKPFYILELGRRIFIILLESIRSKNPIQVVIENYQGIGLESDTDIEGYKPPQDKKTFEYLMWKSAQAFNKKKQALGIQMRKTGGSPVESVIQKSVRLKSQLGDAIKDNQQRDPYEYPFPEIDSDNEGGDIMELDELKGKKKKSEAPKFDASVEIKNFLPSEKRPHKLFLSTRGEANTKVASSLSVSIRQHPYKTANNPGYDSNKDIKKLKQKPLFNDKLNDTQSVPDKNGSNTEIEALNPMSARGEKSVRRQSEPRLSADSSPEILHSKLQDKVMEEMHDLGLNEAAVEVSRDRASEENEHSSLGQHQYAIQVREVFDLDELTEMNKYIKDLDEPGIMVESTEFVSPNASSQLAKNLIQNNKQALYNSIVDFNISILDNYSSNKQTLTNVIKYLYGQYRAFPYFQRVMKLIGQIVNNYPACQIDPQIFAIIVKAQEAQAKTIPQISFSQLVSEQTLCLQYQSKRHLFVQIYEKNLSKFVDSQNIYKITQFVRRVFDNPDYEQQVTWDFILQLCDKIQFCQRQDINFNIQKIQANLSKVNLGVWLRKFDSFQSKVLFSPLKDHLLEVFCNYLLQKQRNEQAIQFLMKVKDIDDSPKVVSTLQNIQ